MAKSGEMFFRITDLFVLSSIVEPFGVAPLEAFGVWIAGCGNKAVRRV